MHDLQLIELGVVRRIRPDTTLADAAYFVERLVPRVWCAPVLAVAEDRVAGHTLCVLPGTDVPGRVVNCGVIRRGQEVTMNYDAFISYSHSADGKLAPAVQSGLQRLARPWYRRRALRVFRDETGLSVNPHLWGSIEKALDESRYFVLLASPTAAQSPWVGREIEHWLATKSPETVLPVLTEGTLAWDAAHGDFDVAMSSALPAALVGVFAEEPKYLDLRWARDESQLDLRNSMFRSQVAALAAPLHGIDKEDLEGEDVRLHRRAMRLAWTAAFALVVLTMAAVTTSIFAVNAAAAARRSERRAVQQQHRADHEATLASAARLAETRQRLVAEQNSEEAQTNASEAKRQKKAADANALRADEQKQAADTNAAAAQTSSAAAQQNAQQAQTNADEAQTNLAVAVAAQADVADKNGQLKTTNQQLNTTVGSLHESNAALGQSNNALRAQRDETKNQRLAGVARQLELGSQLSLAAGHTDQSLLLAAEATNFAGASHGLISDTDLKRSLLAALERNPRQIGTLRGLPGIINAVAVSPDGSRAAAVSAKGRVGIWSLPRPQAACRVRRLRVRNRRLHIVGPRCRQRRCPTRRVPEFRRPVDTRVVVDAADRRVDHESRHIAHAVVVAATPNLGVNAPADIHLLDASSRQVGVVNIADAADQVAITPDGTMFATAGVPGVPPLSVHVFASPTTEIASFTVSDAFAAVDLRFSPDGRRIALLQVPFATQATPLLVWDIATAQPVPVEPPTGWDTVVPGAPIGLSPDLDAIVQRSTTDPSQVGIGHIAAGSFTGGLESTVAPYFGGPPAFTPDNQIFLTTGGDGVVPLFALQDAPHSHIAQTQTATLPAGAIGSALSPDGRMIATVASAAAGGADSLRIERLDGTHRRIDIALSHAPAGFGFNPTHPIAFDGHADTMHGRVRRRRRRHLRHRDRHPAVASRAARELRQLFDRRRVLWFGGVRPPRRGRRRRAFHLGAAR